MAWGPEPFPCGPGRLLYLCRSGCAQNGGGQAAGAGGGWGTPGMGREAWLLRYRVGSLRCSGGPGRVTALGPCFRKSHPTAGALGGGMRTALWQRRGGPFPIGAGPAEAAPGLTARGSGGAGAWRRE